MSTARDPRHSLFTAPKASDYERGAHLGTPYCYASLRKNVSCKIGPFLALFYTCLAGSRPYVYRKW